jgi:hypothetical protein
MTFLDPILIGLVSVGLHGCLLPRPPFNLSASENQFFCESPQYISRIVSYCPLIIHLENFLTVKEWHHLIDVT